MLNSQIQYALDDPAGGAQLGQGVHYDQIINVPRLASEAQGEKAETAVQPADPVSDLTNDLGYQTATQVNTAVATRVPTTRTVNGHTLSADISVTKGDVGLGAVENTALSTWAGSTNITTLGTIAAGIKTGAPGGAAGVLKFGKVTVGAVVLDSANYLEVSIDGVVKKLLLAT